MKDAWESYVEDRPTIAWQSWEWYDVVKKHYNVKFFPLIALDDSEIRGILPLYLVKSLFGKYKLISVPYAVAGGIVADNRKIEALLLAKAVELYNSLHCSIIMLKQYKTKVDGDLRVDENFYNRELDLTQGVDTLWNNLNDVNKTNIRAAEKFTVTLEHPSANINQFYKLLLKHHQHSGVPCVSQKWIRDLVGFQMYSIAILKQGNKIVAGTMVKEHKQTVSFPFTSIPDPSEESNMFAYNLYWLLIKKFSREGKAIFHSGRIPKNDITNCYRLGWNGSKHNYYYQYYPDTSGSSEFSSKRGRKRIIVNAVWKKLPISLAGMLGPKIVKYFP